MPKPNIQTSIAILFLSKHIKLSDLLKSFLDADVVEFLSSNEPNKELYEDSQYFDNDSLCLFEHADIISAAASVVSSKIKLNKQLKVDLDIINQTDLEDIFKTDTPEEIENRTIISKEHKFHFDSPLFKNMFPLGIDGNSVNLIAAASNVGKTTIMIQLAIDAARSGKKVYYASFEESIDSIYMKLVRNFYNIGTIEAYERVTNHNTREIRELISTNLRIKSFNFQVSVEDYLEDINKNKYDIIFCDYFQHFLGDEKKEDHVNYKKFAQKIMHWCKEPGRYVPFFSGMQFNRSGVSDNEKLLTGEFRGSLEHLGGSIGSHQQADNVVNLYAFPSVALCLAQEVYGLAVFVTKARSGGKKDELFISAIDKTTQRIVDCSNINLPGKESIPTKRNNKSKELDSTPHVFEKLSPRQRLEAKQTAKAISTDSKFGDVKAFIEQQLDHSHDDFINDIKDRK